MRRPHLTESVFLADLGKMYAAAAKLGLHTVWLTMKPVGTKRHKKSGNLLGGATPVPLGCLVRATNGKKTSSCVVEPHRAKAFQVGLQAAMATHVQPLPAPTVETPAPAPVAKRSSPKAIIKKVTSPTTTTTTKK